MSNLQLGTYLPWKAAPEDGWQDTIHIDDPPSDGVFSFVVPGSRMVRLLAVQAALLTTAAAPTRSLNLAVVDANSRIVAFIPNAAGGHPPSTFFFYLWTPAMPVPVRDASSGSYGGPTPPVILPPGWSVQLQISNFQPGDQLSRINLTMERIPTGKATEELIAALPTPVVV